MSTTDGINKITSIPTSVSTETPSTMPTEILVDSDKYKVMYQGFILVNSDETNDYSMTHDYIITNEADWEIWNSKYTKQFPYYLNDMDMDWENECLIAYAYTGAKDSFNIYRNIINVSFENNKINIEFNQDVSEEIYVFNPLDKYKDGYMYHVGFYVIKINKQDNFSSFDQKYFSYENYTQFYKTEND